MSLEEKVSYLIINHDYSVDGVHSLTPKVIALVLNKAKEVFVEQGSILKGVMAIEQLKREADE